MSERIPTPANDNIDITKIDSSGENSNLEDFRFARIVQRIPETLSRLNDARERIKLLVRTNRFDSARLASLQSVDDDLASLERFGLDIKENHERGLKQDEKTVLHFYNEVAETFATLSTQDQLDAGERASG